MVDWDAHTTEFEGQDVIYRFMTGMSTRGSLEEKIVVTVRLHSHPACDLVGDYLDDITLGGSLESLIDDIVLFWDRDREDGQFINDAECEIIASVPSLVLFAMGRK